MSSFDLEVFRMPSVQLFQGFALGMLGERVNVDSLAECVADSDSFMVQVQDFLASVEAQQWQDAENDMVKLLSEAVATLKDCEGFSGYKDAFDSWTAAEDFETYKSLVGDRLEHHNYALQLEADSLLAQVELGNYEMAGLHAANMTKLAVGPMDQTENGVVSDILALPELAAGFAYGLVTDSDLTEIETCYTSTQPLVHDLMAAVDALEQVHLVKAFEDFEKFVYSFQVDVMPCEHMQDDLVAIKQWAGIFTSPTKLVSTATEHYLLHKRKIQQDVADIKADFAAKEYFKTGETAADLLTTLLGKVEEPTATI